VVGAEQRGQPSPRRLAAGKVRAVTLLRQIADREPWRAQAHASALRLLEAGEQAQQRRLADAVRADYADPAARADGQRDAAEDLVGAVRDGDVGERDRVGMHKGPPDEERKRLGVVS
jgi:hypothetical protein